MRRKNLSVENRSKRGFALLEGSAIGCYSDDVNTPDLDTWVSSDHNMDRNMCSNICFEKSLYTFDPVNLNI